MNTPNDPMAEIRASFFVECDELMEALQDGLQLLDDGDGDEETINVVFRAVHSIKGGAGAFGLEALVRFSHRFENALDEVRSGRMEVDHATLKVFFRAADHLSDLVRISRDGETAPEDETTALIAALSDLLGKQDVAEEVPEEEIDFQPVGLSIDLDLPDGPADDAPPPGDPAAFELPDLTDIPDLPDLSELPDANLVDPVQLSDFDIRFTPSAELFETGNEPFYILRQLVELGEATVTCQFTDLPPFATLAPEVPHLNWQITLKTDVDIAEIQSIFEFVEGLCTLEINGAITGEESAQPANLAPVENPAASTGTAPPPATQGAEDAPKPAKTTAATPHKSVVRVDLDRIERLVNLVGELVINQAMLSQSLEQSGLSPHSDATNGLEEFQRLTRDIQDSVMMIRAQPVKSLFQRMSRIVREASAAVDKDVRLHTTGDTTEVDKTVIERLADPLTHMIRNAVDHGLETTADRVAAGKPPQGNVELSAAHRSGRVIIEVSDDGGGINRPKVLQIAMDKGLIPSDAQLSDTEIDNLLFLPGFSTATVVSDLSGRGVGMDVVRTEIQALGGRISIASEPGQGSTFTISLPLTLAVLDGMVVEVGGETLVLPLNQVIETMTLEEGEAQQLRPGHNVIQVRGGFVPLFDLGAELGYRDALTNFAGSVVLIVAHEDGNRAAVVIDNIVDQRQVVIKGLDASFYRAPGIAAATILGDGQIALILDPSDIISQASTQANAVMPTAQIAGINA